MPGYVLDEAPKAPEDLDHVLVWYTDIRARQNRGMQFEPIGLAETEAYFRLYRMSDVYDLYDLDLLFALDSIWQKVISTSIEKPKEEEDNGPLNGPRPQVARRGPRRRG